jgi:hypothetical protein
MTSSGRLKSSVNYGRDLVHSCFEGANSGGKAALSDPVEVRSLTRAASQSWHVLALGVCAGTLGACLCHFRRPARTVAVAGVLAGAAVSGGIISWSARGLVAMMKTRALKNLNVTRDAHWLASHPITYG